MLRTRVAAIKSLPSLDVISIASMFALFGISGNIAQAQVSVLAPEGAHVQIAGSDAASSPVGLPSLPPMSDPDCLKYDQYNTHIMTTVMRPSVCDTVLPGLFGLRGWLADSGWGIQGLATLVGDYDVLNRHDVEDHKYTGHGGSGYFINNVYLTYDLSRIGFPTGGQFTGSISHMYSQGRTGEVPLMHPRVTNLGITQPLLDNAVEIKAGYMSTMQDFVGTSLSGNAGSVAQGLSTTIPALVGLGTYTPTPTLEFTVKDPATKKFYNHFAVSRSSSADGSAREVAENRSGLRWRTPGTSALFIEEFGYKTEISQEGLPVWARAGFIYNTTNYTKFNGQVADNNYAAYAGLTLPLTKNDDGPGGWNLDIKVDFAPSDRNMYGKDYVINLFCIGPFASRPFDMVSVAFGQTFESRDAQKMVEAFGVRNSSTLSTSGAVSYAYRLGRGVYLISTASAVTNPGAVFADKLPMALILDAMLAVSF